MTTTPLPIDYTHYLFIYLFSKKKTLNVINGNFSLHNVSTDLRAIGYTYGS